jgi:CelD/BcsL family acetyltransferase involved in cellulose biosynthesis
LGVRVEEDDSDAAVEHCYALCGEIGRRKGFSVPASRSLMKALLKGGPNDGSEARLLIARSGDQICAGSFVIRCGRNANYFWGAVDRAFAQQRAGEAVQWASIEWALQRGCTLYDLEGIDPQKDPGTYAFKKKTGGLEVSLKGKQYLPLSPVGRVAAWLEASLR